MGSPVVFFLSGLPVLYNRSGGEKRKCPPTKARSRNERPVTSTRAETAGIWQPRRARRSRLARSCSRRSSWSLATRPPGCGWPASAWGRSASGSRAAEAAELPGQRHRAPGPPLADGGASPAEPASSGTAPALPHDCGSACGQRPIRPIVERRGGRGRAGPRRSDAPPRQSAPPSSRPTHGLMRPPPRRLHPYSVGAQDAWPAAKATSTNCAPRWAA